VNIKAWVDDVLVQDGNTRDMYHKWPDIISYCSYGHTIFPGDILSWGTITSKIEDMNAKKVDLLGRGGNLITEIEGIGKMINPIKKIDFWGSKK
jgi:2-keto-4-pentenoate hydratase/2-oxohepta-3-ene-1,7-dioic acid hydratase in catechol pathway